MDNIGVHIRARRESFGLSAEEVATLARIPSARVEAIEAGAVLSSWELACLADALAIEPRVLMTGELDDPRRSAARFRYAQEREPLSPRDLRLLARATDVGRTVAYLRERLDEPASKLLELRQVRGVASYPEPWKQGYELGEAARLQLVPHRGRIESLQQLLEGLGVHVAMVAFDNPHIEAASLFEGGASPVILVNAAMPKNRYPPARRAVLAHELCHLLHDGGQRDLLTLVTRAEDSSLVEQRANGFAPSFLAPRRWVRAQAKEPRDIVKALAEEWGLSFEGATWHAKNLKLISPEDAEQLQRLGRKPPLSTEVEPDLVRTLPEQMEHMGIEVEPTPLVSGLLSELALRASKLHVISRGRAREILCLQ